MHLEVSNHRIIDNPVEIKCFLMVNLVIDSLCDTVQKFKTKTLLEASLLH